MTRFTWVSPNWIVSVRECAKNKKRIRRVEEYFIFINSYQESYLFNMGLEFFPIYVIFFDFFFPSYYATKSLTLLQPPTLTVTCLSLDNRLPHLNLVPMVLTSIAKGYVSDILESHHDNFVFWSLYHCLVETLYLSWSFYDFLVMFHCLYAIVILNLFQIYTPYMCLLKYLRVVQFVDIVCPRDQIIMFGSKASWLGFLTTKWFHVVLLECLCCNLNPFIIFQLSILRESNLSPPP